MRTYKKKRKATIETVNEVISITCNKCGVTDNRGVNNDGYDNGFSNFTTYFGFGSIYDNERWSFDLCDDCLTDVVRTFAIVPTGFGQDSYFATYPQKMFDKWKETGEVDLEAGMTAEEIEANGGSIYED